MALILPWKTYDTFKAAMEDADMVIRREKQPMRVWVCRTGDAGRLLSQTDPVNGGMRDRFHRLVVRPVASDGTPDITCRLTSVALANPHLRWGVVVILYHETTGGRLEIEQVDQVNLEPYQCWEEVWQ